MKKRKDLTGTFVGELKILKEINVPYSGKDTKRKTLLALECQCICGNIFYPYKTNVVTGKTKRCARCAIASNHSGKKIGKLTILQRFWPKNDGRTGVYYSLLCQCGNIYEESANIVRNLKGIRCPQCPTKKSFVVSKQEANKRTGLRKHLKCRERIVGKKFGYLKCLEFDSWEQGKNRRHSRYKFRCKCGQVFVARGNIIYTTLSCGCLQKENAAKGERNPRAALSDAQALEVLQLIKTKMYTQREIAKMFKIDETLVSSIKLNKCYSHVNIVKD